MLFKIIINQHTNFSEMKIVLAKHSSLCRQDMMGFQVCSMNIVIICRQKWDMGDEISAPTSLGTAVYHKVAEYRKRLLLNNKIAN